MILRLDGVTKRYAGRAALENLSVEVAAGAIGLLGPNGAGKSTLIKVLLGLVRLTSGSASVLDLDVRRSATAIRQRVGYMPEDDCYVAGLKGVELVAHAGEIAGMPRQEALRRAHEILDYVRLDEARYREVQTYSTGMKQRVKLAFALVNSPELVFLDEPTSGMDPDGREQMLALIRDLAKNGISVVVSTHILHDIEVCCDAVLIIAKGKLLEYERLAVLQKPTTDAIVTRVATPPARLVEALQRRGLGARVTDEELVEVSGNGDGVTAAIFAAARECGAEVRELTPARSSLEAIFLKALRGSDANP